MVSTGRTVTPGRNRPETHAIPHRVRAIHPALGWDGLGGPKA